MNIILKYLDSSKSIGNYKCVATSNPNYLIEPYDTQMIDFLRKWTIQYMFEKNSLFYPKTISVNQINELSNENDLTVIVANKETKDDLIIFTMLDETDMCSLQCSISYDYINIGDVVRVRSLKWNNK